MAMSITCNYMRAVLLEVNVVLSGDFNSKYGLFCDLFPGTLEKEKFRRKLVDFTAYVRKKAACIGEKRERYIEKYGQDSWSLLSDEDKQLHTPICSCCEPDINLFIEPKGFRTKYRRTNKQNTPATECTPPLKKSNRRVVTEMNAAVSEAAQKWDMEYDCTFVDVLRKNKQLNLTPRKTKVEKQKEKRCLHRKVFNLMHNH